MKKALFTAAILGFMMSSCKKNYVCECVETSNDPDYAGDSYKFTTPKMKKKDAETHCSSLETSWSFTNFNGETVTVEDKCELED